MKLELSERIRCKHVKSDAHWLSSNKRDILKRLYLADPASAARELAGVVADDACPAFDLEDIERAFTSKHVYPKGAPRMIFVSIDPSGGGGSNLGLASGYFQDDLSFVVSFFLFCLTQEILGADIFDESRDTFNYVCYVICETK
jgi:hypothetical protein